jgi:hypothetical protein
MLLTAGKSTNKSVLGLVHLNMYMLSNKICHTIIKKPIDHLLFYRKVLEWLIRICILPIHTRFIGCLLLEKSIKNQFIINNNFIINALFSIVKPILPLILR